MTIFGLKNTTQVVFHLKITTQAVDRDPDEKNNFGEKVSSTSSKIKYCSVWHTSITEQGVPAKTFSKLICYCWIPRNQNREKKLTPKSRKKINYLYSL